MLINNVNKYLMVNIHSIDRGYMQILTLFSSLNFNLVRIIKSRKLL